jgi:large subunit ribosomal protein L21
MFQGYGPLLTGWKGFRMYAIFKALGKQYRAEKGATLQLPYMEEKQPGDTVSFDEVLLTSNGDSITAGTPVVKGASVTAEVVGHGKEDKIYVFKFKRRKNYRRKTGHRQKYTEVKITDVVFG